jgi:NADH-quinone oxidoreductase subunit G
VATVYINDQPVEVPDDSNAIQAAQAAGVEIPHYCWHPELTVVASCRMCLVEVGERKEDGQFAMQPKLVPGCQTKIRPNMAIRTATPTVQNAQAQTLEYLLLNHPLDCSICDQAGECYLQDYTYRYGRAKSRLNEPKVQRQDKYHIGDQIALFTDRCVMCTRCVRFTREISGTSELHVISRGSVEEIDVAQGHPCNNKLAGNVVDLCPVGALCSKDFLYKQRVWWLKSQDSVCNRCSTGCSIHIDQNDNRIYRLRPRENRLAQGSFMCDEGRFGWKEIHQGRRLTGPRVGVLEAGGSSEQIDSSVWLQHPSTRSLQPDSAANAEAIGAVGGDPWKPVEQAVAQMVAEWSRPKGGKWLFVFSPMMTVEEAYLLAEIAQRAGDRAVLAMGPVPVVGQDDLYPKDHRGQPPVREKAKFTIRAEKCPNREGVRRILEHYRSEPLDWAGAVDRLAKDRFEGAFVVAGYWESPWTVSDLEVLCRLPHRVVLDYLRSPLSDAATCLLAGGSFAEREGTFINAQSLAQAIRPAIRSVGESRSDGRILWDLAGRQGLFRAVTLRQEIGRKIPSLRGLEKGDLGEQGVRLNQPNNAQPEGVGS